MQATKTKHGVQVVPGEIAISDFLKKVSGPKGSNRFDGSWAELIELAKWNFSDNEPGTGSVDGDVILVNVPPEGFRTNIVSVADADKYGDVEDIHIARVEGEAEVHQKIIEYNGKLPDAGSVQLVLYRADTLDRDAGRSSLAEWEIVSVNTAPYDEPVPMDPVTMKRNAQHDEGGTYREYTDTEWAESYAFWNVHANLRSTKSLKRTPDWLKPHITDRGFKQYPAIEGEYGGTVSVYESSGSDKAIWLKTDTGDSVLLTEESAYRLVDVVKASMRDHWWNEVHDD